ncbi:hypothetical protein PENTCL1PPCAC_5834, partial [Pristionchus entomophagus]
MNMPAGMGRVEQRIVRKKKTIWKTTSEMNMEFSWDWPVQLFVTDSNISKGSVTPYAIVEEIGHRLGEFLPASHKLSKCLRIGYSTEEERDQDGVDHPEFLEENLRYVIPSQEEHDIPMDDNVCRTIDSQNE